jgi:hypothetical protein
VVNLNTDPVQIWPGTSAPNVWVDSLGGQAVPVDPRLKLDWPTADMSFSTAGAQTAIIKAQNVPVDGSWKVSLRVMPTTNKAVWQDATFQSGDLANSTWTASVNLGAGYTVLQAKAYKL